MGNKIIAVDCDLVLVDTVIGWWDDLLRKYQLNKLGSEVLNIETKYPYNLSSMFEIPEGDDPVGYWKSSTLYEGLKPIEGSVEVLSKLKEMGYDIVVVSRVTGDHAESKCKWLKKWFPFIDGIILTGANKKEKSYVRCTYVIDDSLEQLVEFPDDVIKLHYDTPYYQTGVRPPSNNFFPVRDWKHIAEVINEFPHIGI
jgi:5'(3')-deoxyribonucleotidase